MGYDYLSQWSRQPGGTLGGSLADILLVAPYVNSGLGTGYGITTVGWTGILNAADSEECGGACSYAQDGWQEYPDSNGTSEMDTFFEYTQANGLLTHSIKFECPIGSLGSTWTYSTLYGNAGPGELSFDYNGGNACGEPQAVDWTPTAAVQAGETKNLASQMPGGYHSGAHETFNNSKIWYSGGWNNFNGSGDVLTLPSGYGSNYGNSVNSNHVELSVWDNACAY